MHRAILLVFCASFSASLSSSPIRAQNAPLAAPPVTATKLDTAGPSQIGRTQLVRQLNSLAATYTAARAQKIAAIHTRGEAEICQSAARKQILALLGPLPERTPLNAEILGITQAESFRIEKVLFDSQPGFPVTALLYVPEIEKTSEKLPAILMTPGHSPAGKAGDAGTAALFARNGFVVLSYDPIGQGERLQYPDPAHPGTSLATRPTGEHGEASLQPMLIGDTLARYVLWDAMRGIDYLSQLPQVDAHRIGALGCSGGGAMTALAAAIDTRIAAVGVACYTTSFDTLLSSIGPQDGEQSSPRFISSGLDFPDWIELAAPRPYAVIATYSDMFPFAGARSSVVEARRFYSLFDPASAGIPTESLIALSNPTEPALNVDTANIVSASAKLQFITGPGGHGALAPIMDKILSFFLLSLAPEVTDAHLFLPPPPPPGSRSSSLLAGIPKDAFQVTPTGQVATSYPEAETVFSLNRKHAAQMLHVNPQAVTGKKLVSAIREITGGAFQPGSFHPDAALLSAKSGSIVLSSGDGVDLQGDLAIPSQGGKHAAVLLLVPDSIHGDNPMDRANKARFDALVAAGNVVLAITLRPSPPGTDDMKSPILGPFYLLSLRADLVGRTLVGMRMDDVVRATDYLASRPDVLPGQISAQASGHLGLVLLHAAVLDPRLKQITVDHALTSYRSLLAAPLPIGAPEDILPGVLLRYDIPDLVRALGGRLTLTDPLQGSDDLSQTSTPLKVLKAAS